MLMVDKLDSLASLWYRQWQMLPNVPHPCEKCGAVVIRRKRGRFCGWACFQGWLADNPEMFSECPTCGTRFRQRLRSLPRKYCSSKCIRPGKRSFPCPTKKPRATGACETCGKLYEFCPTGWTHSRRFCSRSCAHIHVAKLLRVDTPKSTRMSHRKGIARCERCGWAEALEVLQVHHKDHNRENDTPDNWEVLCPTCHRLHHWREKRRHRYVLKA